MNHVETARSEPRIGATKEYRGHVITLSLHGFQVTMQKVHICWASSFEDGERKIDRLAIGELFA